MGTRFAGISGVKDFYTVIHAAFPDFQIAVTGEYDTPGCSIREVTITGTHLGDYMGVPASGNPVLLRQVRGDLSLPTKIGLVEFFNASASVEN